MTPEPLGRLLVGRMAIARNDLTAAPGTAFDIAPRMVVTAAYHQAVVTPITLPRRNF
jgi:hypothetical protein